MQENKRLGITYGLPLGVGAAFAIGLPTDSLGLWIGICLPAGLIIGMIYDSIKNRDTN